MNIANFLKTSLIIKYLRWVFLPSFALSEVASPTNRLGILNKRMGFREIKKYSLRNRFDVLPFIIENNIDIHSMSETKLDTYFFQPYLSITN